MLMVPCSHITVANRLLLQGMIQIQVQTEVQNSKFSNVKKMFIGLQIFTSYLSCGNQHHLALFQSVGKYKVAQHILVDLFNF